MKNILIILSFIAVASCELLTDGNITPFVSNGTKADLGEFPYHVAIVMFTEDNASICSGTFIKHKWVLTTAACLNYGFVNYTLRFGSVDLIKGEKAWESGVIQKSNFKIHPDYDRYTNVNNIALIYVEDMPANLTDHKNVGFIDFPSESDAKTNLTGKIAVISGYGLINDTVDYTEGVLYHTITEITSNDVCQIIQTYNVTEHDLCALPIDNKSVCRGDYGSAMTVEISSKNVLVGIATAIPKFCSVGIPVIYENVFYHREWILHTMNGSSVVSVGFSFAALMIMMKMKKIFIIFNLLVIACHGQQSEDTNILEREMKVGDQNIVPTITNGSRAILGQFPYQVAITMNMAGGQAVCGGSLIKHKWVLTSAHCIRNIYTNFRVTFATLNAFTGSHEWRSDIIPRGNLHIHPEFNITLIPNNIGLIYVSDMPETLTNSPNVGFVEMPNDAEANLNLIGRTGTTSGYGRTIDNVNLWDPILHYTTHDIIANNVCESVYNVNLSNRNLCVDTTTGGSPCASDAGGPMTIQINPERRILVGIVGITPSFCTIGNPGIYESVAAHRDWIERTINGSSMIGVSFAIVAAAIMMTIKNSL
ncbi:uncharacterized protein [Chironomus tepperi]|uniref:uncharacterized protein n=1 Tax=Chironomus tepperi TaxID=113505 RepID=UPI00391FA68D